MATFTTYDQVGAAEDVSDVISNITPADTPFYSSIGTEKIAARLFEWQEDELEAGADNAKIEGAEAVDGTLNSTTMRSNNTQIFTDAFKISATSDAVKTHGRAKETAYQLGKRLKEIKKDVEHAMVGRASQAAVTGDASTARRFANVYNQIHADMVVDALISTVVQPLTENHLLDAGQKLYASGGDGGMFMIKPADSLKVAGFANSAGRNREITQKEVVNVVNLYVSPFGEYKVVMNREILSTQALLYSKSNWKTAILRPFTRTLLAKTGDADRHFIVGEISLKHVNQKASALISGLAA